MSSKNKIEKLSKVDLENIVLNSNNVHEALKKVGYSYSTSAYADKLFKRCNQLNIDSSHIYYDTSKEKVCVECGKTKPLIDFYDRRIVCKECVKKKENDKAQLRRNLLNDYKQEQCCAKCRDNRFYVLDFHHINPSEKEYTIAQNTRIKFENLKKELDKCVVLCANCHREFHFLNQNQNISIEEYLEEWGNGSPRDC